MKQKKFRLIKELPNCNIGDIAICDGGYFVWELSQKELPQTFYPYNAKGWWDEIIERDFKILEFDNMNKDLFISEKGLYYCNENNGHGFTLNSMLHAGECVDNGNFAIHKVKSLSTGEVFTVGDSTNKGKIKRFYIISDTMIVDIVNKKECCRLHELKHAKNPIFSTLDGVDIYDGQPYVYIDCDNNIKNIKEADKYSGGLTAFRYFSTKEAAQEYLIQNLEVLSLNDIKYYLIGEVAEVDIKEIIKKKLNIK